MHSILFKLSIVGAAFAIGSLCRSAGLLTKEDAKVALRASNLHWSTLAQTPPWMEVCSERSNLVICAGSFTVHQIRHTACSSSTDLSLVSTCNCKIISCAPTDILQADSKLSCMRQACLQVWLSLVGGSCHGFDSYHCKWALLPADMVRSE